MKATYFSYILKFKRPGGTSRGILKTKQTFFLKIIEGEQIGIGECALFRGLSVDDRIDYEQKMKWVCENITLGKDKLLEELKEFPSIQFGVETAFLSFQAEKAFELFPSEFTRGNDAIVINGLIWMGEKNFMKQQIAEKLDQGFGCIKLKIGALDFDTELELLKSIRSEFNAKEVELRVDANGAFSPQEALEKLNRLSEFDLHSIEQPIKAGQWEEMANLCEKTPLPIALDEELIGIFENKAKLLTTIMPQYIILKPALVGGFSGSEAWISEARKTNIGWWATSALESNIGLNALAQWVYTKKTSMPQGLGTGKLFTNNISSPLYIEGEKLSYAPEEEWGTIKP